MSRIKDISSKVLSLALSGVVLLTSYGFIVSSINKSEEMNSEKNAVVQTMLRNEEIFSEQYASYDEYINLIKDEIVNTEMHTSAMDVFAAYSLLQHNGLISLGDDFDFGVADYEVFGNLGMSVITGKSVCRNQAYNLYRVFQALGYDASVSYGELYSTNFISGTNNHAVTCVCENGTYYLFDPTNKTIFMRSALGQFISIDCEDDKFYPSPYGDEIFLTLSDNAGLHVYFADDYGSKVTYTTRRKISEKKAEEHAQYYADYENDYLLEIEEQIDADLREYFHVGTPGIHDNNVPNIQGKVLQMK